VRITGVILAGGNNSRFEGRVKSKLLVAGKPVIAWILNAMEGLFEEILIVTNTPEEFKEYSNCRLVTDLFFKVGPLGGIHAALKAASSDAIFVFAGDMPLINKNLITSQIEYYNKTKCDVLVPLIGQDIEPLHAIYNISTSKVLENQLKDGTDYAVRTLFNRLNVKYLELEDSDDIRNSFFNINTPSDLLVAEKITPNPTFPQGGRSSVFR
jgi:molybdopterin-guanine dinucleotide biosynthesis protein A